MPLEDGQFENVIVVNNLMKKFGNFVAVNGLNLTVKEGEIFGFLGPNGAGKTTTVRILSTLTGFDAGEVIVDGYDLLKDPLNAKRRMGVIQQHISLDKDLTVKENMIQHAMYHKIPPSARNEKIAELAHYVGLADYLDRMVESLSGGWKKRVAIVCSLIHNPKILFLDEPTVGLDIQARRLLWDLIRKLNHDGTTIFLTTHYIEEAEALCDRVGIINHGKIIALGTPTELCGVIGATAVECYGADGKTTYHYFSNREEANDFARTIPDGTTVTIRNTNLEDCFVELTGETVGDMR